MKKNDRHWFDPNERCVSKAISTGLRCRKQGAFIEALQVYKCDFHHPYPACAALTQRRKRCKRKGVIKSPPDANGVVRYYCTEQHLIRDREEWAPATSEPGLPADRSVPADPTPAEDGLLDALQTEFDKLALLMHELRLARNK